MNDFMKLSPAERSKFTSLARPFPWPPEEVEISSSSDPSGLHGNFSLRSLDSLRQFNQEVTAFQTADLNQLTQNSTIVVSQASMDEELKKALAWLAQHQDEYLKAGKAILVPVGAYPITGFFDKFGRPLQVSSSPFKVADVWAEFTYEGHPVYTAINITDLWFRSHNSNSSVPTTFSPPVNNKGPGPQTKQEWKAAVPQNVSQTSFGNILCNREVLFKAVGQPSRSEAVGDYEYLYWDCSDGQIQLVCARGQFELGYVGGKLNEY